MLNGQTRQNILVDTSIPLEGGEEIIAKLNKVAPVFVTDIVLQELDGHKSNINGAVAYQAREFFRRLGNTNGESLDVLPPDDMKLAKTDTLRKMTLGTTPLHVIVRKPYKSRDINDSKIIEVAKDYNMILVTLDTAQRVRGLSEGVNAVTIDAVLPIESFRKVNEMSKVQKTTGETLISKGESNFPLKATLLFLFIGAVLSDTWQMYGIFASIILIFAFISSALKPINQQEFERKFGKPVESTSKNSSNNTLDDIQYSIMHGNIFHSDDN